MAEDECEAPSEDDREVAEDPRRKSRCGEKKAGFAL
jgi:hypothetical protein